MTHRGWALCLSDDLAEAQSIVPLTEDLRAATRASASKGFVAHHNDRNATFAEPRGPRVSFHQLTEGRRRSQTRTHGRGT